MDEAPRTGDLNLAAVRTLDDLADRLRKVRDLAEMPLRELEARTRHSSTFVSKTVASEMLNGKRRPRKAVMLAFLQECGVPDDALQPWLDAWGRLATNQRQRTRREAPQTTPATERHTDNEIEIRLQEKIDQLTAENERLRQQLANSASFSPQTSTISDLSTIGYPASQADGMRYFAIEDDLNNEQLFYDELTEHIRNATKEVFVLGKGFHDEWRSPFYDSLIQAENEALNRGVKMLRIHSGDLVADSWAQGYAELLKQFPRTFKMVADLDGSSYIDVLVVDPRGLDPVVSLLFESREQVELGFVHRPIAALIIKNARPLARILAGYLYNHSNKGLEKLNSRNIRELASSKTYFAWGVHMYSDKMLRDVPGASDRGTAILRGWRRNIKAMLSGPADRATIERTDNVQDGFDGVAYDISWSGKATMDRLEKRAYKEVDVTIELADGQLVPAFTYVPLPKATEAERLARGSWIDLVVEGARERQMYGLLAELRDAGAPIDTNRV